LGPEFPPLLAFKEAPGIYKTWSLFILKRGIKMRKKILVVFSAFALFLVVVFNGATPVFAGDIPFTPLTLTEAVATAAFTDLKNRDPLWYQKDYFIYKYSSTLFAIMVVSKDNGSIVIFDDTIIQDFDLDRVWVDARASVSSSRKDYRYSISTGAYNTTITTTVNGSFIVSGPTYYAYYTNMNLVNRTYDSEYFPNVIIDVPLTKPHLGLGYPNPDWLFQSGVSEEAYWLAMGIDWQEIIAENQQEQTDWIKDLTCFFLFNTDPACDSGDPADSPFYSPLLFFTDFVDGIGGLFEITVNFFQDLFGIVDEQISDSFVPNTTNFISKTSQVANKLPNPLNTVATSSFTMVGLYVMFRGIRYMFGGGKV
jgi:hypothetical protein